MAEYLSPDELDALRTAALERFAPDPAARPLLFQNVLPLYVGTLPVIAAPATQIMSDLMHLNSVERLVDGSVPLQTWLQNAVRLTLEPKQRDPMQRALDLVSAAASGQPDLGDAVEVAETQERAIFRDDTVAFGFMAGGATVGRSVARILVNPYQDGKPKVNYAGSPEPHAGTCWMVGADLVMTNHHVVNARSAMNGPAPQASEADLAAQAAHAVVRFDFDAEKSWGPEIGCTELLAWSADLDYAILRLGEDPGRRPLPLLEERLVAALADNVAVNVIQHPDGGSKRVGLRNNLVNETTDRDVRYFTDTKEGASGSPVLTDAWTVCALHKGSRLARVEFQGKPSAYVNVGTQIAAILEDLKVRYPAVHAEVLTD